jgi:hypothetical protein
LAVAVLVLGVLFSTVFPSFHLARYTLFAWPMLAIHAARGLQLIVPRLWPTRAHWGVALSACALLLAYTVETRARLAMPRGHTLSEVLAAPANRVAATDALLQSMAAQSSKPVVVGTVEVQLRYFVDSRVTVRSLDGLLDERMSRFSHRGALDGLAYLRDRHVEYLLEHPDSLSTPELSYAALQALPVGGRLTTGGMTFTRITRDVTRVTPELPRPRDAS